ncbi:hypothetical protein RSOLAG1IB_12362 [Rhizoctonia solani AG-1 IB]|uniref:Uncharacterized protein n=1 Tax=Thanatephorus cucumeris (strain AG1-IB / isolate 7/3/14) TaxID=1108050 RepID=A0A0B7FW88_THACB|nr:hypothetical protein RSOLAG1IB_12362 [Rhizoctonia solani AG-1 IB]
MLCVLRASVNLYKDFLCWNGYVPPGVGLVWCLFWQPALIVYICTAIYLSECTASCGVKLDLTIISITNCSFANLV